jgi:hypothetical protein
LLSDKNVEILRGVTIMKKITTVFLLVVLTLGLTACSDNVSRDEYDNLRQELDELREGLNNKEENNTIISEERILGLWRTFDDDNYESTVDFKHDGTVVITGLEGDVEVDEYGNDVGVPSYRTATFEGVYSIDGNKIILTVDGETNTLIFEFVGEDLHITQDGETAVFERVVNENSTQVTENTDVGGVMEVVFAVPHDHKATRNELDSAKSILETRMITKNLNVQRIDVNYSTNRINIRFSWSASNEAFSPEQVVSELGEMAELSFREGLLGNGEDAHLDLPLILTGRDVRVATPNYDPDMQQAIVSLEFNESGSAAFSDATRRLALEHGIISIWIDNSLITAPSVQSHITGGMAQITGGNNGFTIEEATALANKINGGALPFALITENFEIIN